jgi:hypothetical protein
MSFELFNEPQIKEEVRQMLLGLKKADYAISDLSREDIEKWAKHFSVPIKLRTLKSGRIKVRRI